MGSEESVPRRNQESQSQVTQNEMDRILERQRMQYEQRCWEILQANLPTTSNTQNTQRFKQQNRKTTVSSVTNTRLTSTPTRTSPAVIASSSSQQSSSTASANQLPPRTVPPRPAPPRNTNAPYRSSVVTSPTQNQNNLERSRTPYSLTQDDLQSRATNAYNLYPNLHTANAGVTSNTPTTNRAQRNGNSNVNTDFVFVNNNGNIQRATPSAPPARDRSASRPRSNRNDDNSASCRTCNKLYGAYIYQCATGHSSCQDCRTIARPCGLCGQRITEMRNITMEAYMSELTSPCPNKSDGCNIFIKLANMETHIKECPFKILDCPLAAIFGNCRWKGKLNQISKHFNDVHPEHIQIGVDTEAYLPNICTNNQVIHYITLGNFNFLFCLKVSQADRKIYAVAQLLGTSMSAAKWDYELHIYNKREPRRKYQYNDICHSTWVPIDDIIKESKCGAIPLEHAMTFVNEGVITYKFFLKRESEGTRNFGNKQFGRGGRRKN